MPREDISNVAAGSRWRVKVRDGKRPLVLELENSGNIIGELPEVDNPPVFEDGVWKVLIKAKGGLYRYELLDSGQADVFKSADALTPAYSIRDGICSCPAAIHSKACKHIKTVQHIA